MRTPANGRGGGGGQSRSRTPTRPQRDTQLHAGTSHPVSVITSPIPSKLRTKGTEDKRKPSPTQEPTTPRSRRPTPTSPSPVTGGPTGMDPHAGLRPTWWSRLETLPPAATAVLGGGLYCAAIPVPAGFLCRARPPRPGDCFTVFLPNFAWFHDIPPRHVAPPPLAPSPCLVSL